MTVLVPNCIINGIKIRCHLTCKTCALNSLCDNENACTSCFPGHYKVSQKPNDTIFKCTNSCDVLAWKYKDGYSFCKSFKKVTVDISNLTSANSTTMVHGTYNEHQISITVLLIICIFLTFIIILLIIWHKKRNSRKRKEHYYRNPELVVAMKPNSQLLPSNFIAIEKNRAEKSYSSLEEININEFKKIRFIGGGAYSEVYQGTLRDNPVAIKVAVKKGRKSIHKELKIYAKISHQHILQAVGIHLGVENILFLSLRKYDLTKYFTFYSNKLDFLRLHQYSIQIADAMKYLHEKNILHCDLKIDNILIKDDKGEYVEIADFGCAIDLTYDRDARYLGTETHTSYELLKKSLNPKFPAKASTHSDVWSFAVTSWQIFQKSHELPPNYGSKNDIITNYEQGKKLPTPAMASHKFWQYIFYQCFDLDPETRPTMDELYNKLKGFKEHSSVT